MIFRFQFILLLTLGVALLRVTPASAATYTSDGCFEREHEDGAVVLWMQDVACEIHVVSSDGSITERFTIKNIDPKWYEVINSEGTRLSVKRNTTQLTFDLELSSSANSTITIQPWDDTSEKTDFWFAAISDPQPQPGGDVPNPIFIEIMDQIEMIHPPFVTISGDLIGGDPDDGESHEAEYDLLDDVLTDFEGSTFTVPGDHDAENDLDLYYSAFFGDRDYTFVYGNTRFIGINTTENINSEGTLTDEQLAWLQTTLQSATERHRIIFMQHPLIPPEWANSEGIADEALRKQLAELFVQYGVELIIVGDAHGYDWRIIDSDDIEGLTGSFYQLDAAGAGGRFVNYGGDHFFTLVHVSDDGIEHYKFDYSTFDLSLQYDGVNDGSASSVGFTVFNNQDVDIPSMRIPIAVDATTEHLYASTDDGAFFSVTSSETEDGIRRGYVEISVEPNTTTHFTVQEHRRLMTGVENLVGEDGAIRFASLPTTHSKETNLSVVAEQTSRITIDRWKEGSDQFEWLEKTARHSATAFFISGLLEQRQYNVWVNGKLKDRVSTDEEGNVEFTFAGRARLREYRFELHREIMADRIGVLPSSDGGPHLRLYGEGGALLQSFFAYDEKLTSGISSLWVDIDGDGDLEIATIPDAGVPGHLRIFEQNGEAIAAIFPFGEEFRGGMNMTAGDVNGDGSEEVIVVAQGDRISTVKVYTFNSSGLQKISGFRPFEREYTGGVALSTGDLNGDGDDEIVVSAEETMHTIKIYHWKDDEERVKFWFGKRVASNTQGIAIATGDLNFDGDDEVVVKTLGDIVQVFAYQKGRRRFRLVTAAAVFAPSGSSGVDYIIGNVDRKEQEELIVTSRGGEGTVGMVKVLRLKDKKLHEMSALTPFGPEYDDGITITVADFEHDGRSVLITAREKGEDRVRIFEQRQGYVQQIDAYDVYDSAFSGGLHLTESL